MGKPLIFCLIFFQCFFVLLDKNKVSCCSCNKQEFTCLPPSCHHIHYLTMGHGEERRRTEFYLPRTKTISHKNRINVKRKLGVCKRGIGERFATIYLVLARYYNVLLGAFLGEDYLWVGFQVISTLVVGYFWWESSQHYYLLAVAISLS